MQTLRLLPVIASSALLSACSVTALIDEVEGVTETILTTTTTIATNAVNAPVRATSFSTQSGAFDVHQTETLALPGTGSATFTGNALLAHTGPATAPHVAHVGVAEMEADFAAMSISGTANEFANNVITEAQYDALLAGTWTLVPGLFVNSESLEGEIGILRMTDGTINSSGALTANVAGTLDDGTDSVTVGGSMTGTLAGEDADSLSLNGATTDALTITYEGSRSGIFQVFATQ